MAVRAVGRINRGIAFGAAEIISIGIIVVNINRIYIGADIGSGADNRGDQRTVDIISVIQGLLVQKPVDGQGHSGRSGKQRRFFGKGIQHIGDIVKYIILGPFRIDGELFLQAAAVVHGQQAAQYQDRQSDDDQMVYQLTEEIFLLHMIVFDHGSFPPPSRYSLGDRW